MLNLFQLVTSNLRSIDPDFWVGIENWTKTGDERSELENQNNINLLQKRAHNYEGRKNDWQESDVMCFWIWRRLISSLLISFDSVSRNPQFQIRV